jgi:hypothetical protein
LHHGKCVFLKSPHRKEEVREEEAGAGEVLRASSRLGTGTDRTILLSPDPRGKPDRLFLNIGLANPTFELAKGYGN